jgi:LmbE family N-acetylglucosaminyl deacetylase
MMHSSRSPLRAAAVLLGALSVVALASERLAQDHGASGAWQALLKLTTTASVMHTTAHPDDEHGGLLAWLSRGHGAHVSLLTLNRGEGGDNAIGPELFDALGLIRTEELRVAGRYYGIDRQYFTTVADYGFSKRLDEALEKWGREEVLGEVVRLIRRERPLVIISRFQGSERDGHGNHQAAGLITRDAHDAAGDPARFPEQLSEEGLRAWQPLKLYMGGVRENEDWNIRVDTGEYSPWIGESYQTFGRIGLSFQRSQTSGRLNPVPGPAVAYYKRLDSRVPAPDREESFFDGIDTRLSGLMTTLGRPASRPALERLDAAEAAVREAVDGFSHTEPWEAAPALARGLAAIREAARLLEHEPDVGHALRLKEEQFQEAITRTLGIAFISVALPADVAEPSGPFAAFMPQPEMSPVVPGQRFQVASTLTNRGRIDLEQVTIELSPGRWMVEPADGGGRTAGYNQPVVQRFTARVPDDARLSKPYFSRTSIAENRYVLDEPRYRGQPAANPPLVAIARYHIDGVAVEARTPVRRREANLPYGYEMRELAVLPAIGVKMSPKQAVLPLGDAARTLDLHVELVNNAPQGSEGHLTLEMPGGWTVEPSAAPFQFGRAGERRVYDFHVTPGALADREYVIRAVANAGGQEFREGYDELRHRDLETRYLFHDAIGRVRGLDVQVTPNLTVGYVMGVGDEIPAGIAQLGARVVLLEAHDLASGDLGCFDAIITGTRAYAVRDDLRTYNQRLLDYVHQGGNLIVLYNTAEFVPGRYAPFPGELTPRAEEVSEEDSPVTILAPDHPVLRAPNRITLADFDNWVEQRGSKFWSAWDNAYTALIATHDRGQEPQKGGWLHARYGKGHYTYFAYAFHRQLPYGVPGAYRLLANLLAMGRG